MTALQIKALVAMDEGRVIGADNSIPWHIPEDMKHVARLTTGHTVIMGRKTYDSLPKKFRPLPNRKNVVFTRSPETLADEKREKNIEVWQSPEAFFQAADAGDVELPSEEVWVLGGEAIYKETLSKCHEIHLTAVAGRHEGDTFFPEFEEEFQMEAEELHDGIFLAEVCEEIGRDLRIWTWGVFFSSSRGFYTRQC